MSFLNNTHFSECCGHTSNHHRPIVQTVLIFLGVGILSLTTVFGNLLIILAYYDNKKIRNLANIPIISLAFTDLFIGLYPMNVNVLEMTLRYWPLGHVMCNVSLTFDYVCVQTSINHIVLINFDRYLSIKSPMKHRLQQKTPKVMFRLFVVWFFGILIWVPYINSYMYVFRDKFNDKKCYTDFLANNTSSYKTIMFIVTSVVGYFIPLGIVLTMYFKMYNIIKKQLYESNQTQCALRPQETKEHIEIGNLAYNPVSCSNATETSCYFVPSTNSLKQTYEYQKKQLDSIVKQKKILRHKKSLRMIASIILAFLITGLPLNAQWFVNGICKKCYNGVLFDIFNFITYPNSTVNPFLYAFVSRAFRLQYKRILFGKKRFRDAERQIINNSI
ncbi:muscarinic acetylcholine receptor M2 [Hydra vulgaris]|uniref:muscarinic acetylcholine receptor M2 n=1 Tax=Hydra vulgaris TaxID=6087 RepID=UPI001F5F9731|nr:muscarinic acetylcholine receptor M2 [Hydra vulgaris]